MARSLVERLEAYANALGPGWHGDSARVLQGVSKLAAPYEARREALEKAAKLAEAVLSMTMCPSSDDDLVAVGNARRLLRDALAAVPEIPEES